MGQENIKREQRKPKQAGRQHGKDNFMYSTNKEPRTPGTHSSYSAAPHKLSM